MQTYFNGNSLVKLMDELGFDAYRLGVIQADMVRAETLVRSADMVSVDINSVRLSDAPAHSPLSFPFPCLTPVCKNRKALPQ